jgi:tricorn protease
MRRVLAGLLFSALAFSASAQTSQPGNDTRLLRFPTTNGQQIVFAYAGQLYTVPREGGTARRLTSGPGYSSFPRFLSRWRAARVHVALRRATRRST